MKKKNKKPDEIAGIERFGYLLAFLGFIAGLALVEILSGAAALCGGGKVTFYWIPVVWAAILFLVLVQWWWMLWTWRGHVDDTFGKTSLTFLWSLVFPTSLFFACSLLFPDLVLGEANITLGETALGEHVDMKTHYYDHHQWLFGCLALGFISYNIELRSVYGLASQGLEATFRIMAVLPLLLCTFFDDEYVHTVSTLACAAVVLAYIIFFNSPMVIEVPDEDI